jgi:hypothetical protein
MNLFINVSFLFLFSYHLRLFKAQLYALVREPADMRIKQGSSEDFPVIFFYDIGVG